MATAAKALERDRTRAHSRAFSALTVAFVVVATIALGGLAFAAHTTPYFGIDLAVAHAVQSIHAQWFDVLMQVMDWPGFPPQVYVELVVGLAIMVFVGLRWEAVCVLFASVFVGAVGLAIKILVNRPRPSPLLIHNANPGLDGGKYSFTAGHVDSYIAIFGFLWFLAYTSPSRSIWRTLFLFIVGALIALIGVARVYSGEHWFSDVAGAYLFGSITLIITIQLYQWGKTRSFERRL